MDISTALALIKQKDEKRFPHVYGTYRKAQELAQRYNLDIYKCELSAILHDYAKNEPLGKQIEVIKNYLDPALLNYDSAIYHGEVGSILIQNELGITDSDIINAVKYHVTGHPEMNDYAKVVYIADYTEETRKHPGVDYCRNISELSLDLGVTACSEGIYNYLLTQNNNKIHPLTQATYQYFLQKVGVTTYEIIKNNYQSL